MHSRQIFLHLPQALERWGDGEGWLDGVLDVPAMSRSLRGSKMRPSQKGEATDEAL